MYLFDVLSWQNWNDSLRHCYLLHFVFYFQRAVRQFWLNIKQPLTERVKFSTDLHLSFPLFNKKFSFKFISQHCMYLLYLVRSARIAMEAMDILLVACHSQSLNLFVESYLKMVQKLLESSDPEMQCLATASVSNPALALWAIRDVLEILETLVHKGPVIYLHY